MTPSRTAWRPLDVPDAGRPHPLLVRAQTIPPRHYFPEHAHGWNQLAYAVSGVLTVTVEGGCLVVPPEQAVWLPVGTRHRVGSLLGAEFRSLYVADEPSPGVAGTCTTFEVSPLLRALIVEAAGLDRRTDADGYAGRVAQLILDQLRRLQPVQAPLPWPKAGPLLQMCEGLYAAPDDRRGLEAWGAVLGLSGRTLSRRFERDLGLSLRDWRRRLRLFKAVEMLGLGASVTETALDLGYASTSAFTYMVRTQTGRTPLAHRRAALAARPGSRR